MTLALLRSHAQEHASLLRRVHRVTGLFPLGAYLVFHAWEHWPVREGTSALFARLAGSHNAALELVFVLLPLLVHAALGVWLSRRAEPSPSYASPAFRKLQLGSGLVSAAFLGFHLVTTWLPRLLAPTPLGSAYGAMRDRSGDLPGLVLHAVGIAAVCTHFGQGSGVALARLLPARLSPRFGQSLGIALAVLLWLVFLNELASYATLAPLL
jgi:succinate dehydrogenase / fumarate reductase cytochrome b subunit